VPAAIVLIVVAIAAVEGALALGELGLVGGPGGIGWRVAAIERVAVSPAVLALLAERGFADPGLGARFMLYPFVHGGALHALFAAALLLALGKFVGEAMGAGRAVAVFFAASALGAAAYGALLDGTQPLFGAFPGVYGLIGAFTYVQWLRLGALGENRLAAFRLIGLLLAVQLVFGALFAAAPSWVADVFGFVAGGLAAILLAPGGLAALRARLRAR
jgi:membrane associated rhomboid family serine protease